MIGKRRLRIVIHEDGTRQRTLTTRYRFAKRFPNRQYNRKIKSYHIQEVVPLEDVAWKNLSGIQKERRAAVLEARRILKKGKSFSQALKDTGVTKREFQEHLGKYLSKRKDTFKVQPVDRIQRRMPFYEDGKRTSITVTNSKDASLIGRYFSSVRKALETGNESLLKPYKRRVIKDAEGKKRRFETRLEKIFEIEERKEDTPWIVIYETD